MLILKTKVDSSRHIIWKPTFKLQEHALLHSPAPHLIWRVITSLVELEKVSIKCHAYAQRTIDFSKLSLFWWGEGSKNHAI